VVGGRELGPEVINLSLSLSLSFSLSLSLCSMSFLGCHFQTLRGEERKRERERAFFVFYGGIHRDGKSSERKGFKWQSLGFSATT
jgi:hypothetical protein